MNGEGQVRVVVRPIKKKKKIQKSPVNLPSTRKDESLCTRLERLWSGERLGEKK